MVLLPLVALAAVSESAPAETAVSVGSSTTRSISDAELATERVARFASAESGRSSRTRSAAATFAEANPEPATTTTAAPTTTTTTAPPKPTTTTTTKPRPTTTTTAAPKATTTSTSTTAKPRPTTTTSTSTTTTAAPKPTTTTTTTAPAASSSTSGHEEGGASYHDYADPRTCAHRTIAKGTVLTVTNLANGKRTTCVVNDRGPYVDGRILDLSKTAFSEIASLSDGVIRVAIDW